MNYGLKLFDLIYYSYDKDIFLGKIEKTSDIPSGMCCKDIKLIYSHNYFTIPSSGVDKWDIISALDVKPSRVKIIKNFGNKTLNHVKCIHPEWFI